MQQAIIDSALGDSYKLNLFRPVRIQLVYPPPANHEGRLYKDLLGKVRTIESWHVGCKSIVR